MQQVYNGTPLPIRGKAEGRLYIIPPGEVADVQKDLHAEILLRNFGSAGLLRVRFGDEIEDLTEKSVRALRRHLKESAEDRKRHNLEQARLGLKGAPSSPELRAMLRAVFGTDEVEQQDATGLGTIRMLAQAVKKMGDGPRKEKLSLALDELVRLQAEADGIAGGEGAPEDPDEVPEEVGGVAAITAAKARLRERKAVKGKT